MICVLPEIHNQLMKQVYSYYNKKFKEQNNIMKINIIEIIPSALFYAIRLEKKTAFFLFNFIILYFNRFYQ